VVETEAPAQAPRAAVRDDVVVVGAGVIGLASALALLEAGRGVRVLDAGRVGCGSSHGNCGTLTPSHAAPLAAPGTIGKVLRWMLTPDAPFYVKPRFDPALWRWFARFAARCNRDDWLHTMRHKGAILQASRDLYPRWIAEHGLDCEFVESGFDYVFRTQAGFEHDCEEIGPLRDLGIAVQTIDGRTYEAQEPAVKPGVAGVIHFPGDARLRPDRYVSELARAVRERGGVIEEQCEARGIAVDADGVRVDTPLGERACRDLVVAAGAWSPRFARSAGLSVFPIQPGKGYSITYDRPALVPRRPVVLRERSVCVTAWDSGFRLGSTMEFSGYDTALNRRRLDALERGAGEYLHEPVGPAKREEWFGWRPLTFDDLPIIGRVPGHRHVWACTGHGMMGMGMSPASALLLADLMGEREPLIDPAPYRAERFL
jgi:D-amino-acid dehydrogenase